MKLTQEEISQAIFDLQRIQEENPEAQIFITRMEDEKVVTEGFTIDKLKQFQNG